MQRTAQAAPRQHDGRQHVECGRDNYRDGGEHRRIFASVLDVLLTVAALLCDHRHVGSTLCLPPLVTLQELE
nr:MAG: hypothetical protein [Molluscum contagiosum virus]